MTNNVMARKGDRVRVNGLTGTLLTWTYDSDNNEVYTVKLDDPSATPDGFYTAQHYELTWL